MSVSHTSQANLSLTRCRGVAHTGGSEGFELEVWFKPPPHRLGTEFLAGSETDCVSGRQGPYQEWILFNTPEKAHSSSFLVPLGQRSVPGF